MDRPAVRLRRALGRTVVVRQVEVRDAEVERPAQDRALCVQGPVEAEVVPEPEETSGSFNPLRPTRTYSVVA